MNQPATPQQAGYKQGLVLVVVNLLPMMGIVALMPVVPSLLEHFKGVPNIKTLAPLVLSAPGLCIAILSPFAGFFIDKWGRRKLLIRLMIIYGIGGVIPFFVDGFWTLMGGRFLLGIGEAFIMTIVNVLLGDYFLGKQRSNWLMWQGIVGTACGTLLLIISGHLATRGWQYPFLIYSSTFLFAFAAWLFIFEPSNPEIKVGVDKRATKKIPTRTIALLYLLTLSASTIYFVYTLHFSLALDEMGVKDKATIGNLSAIASTAVPVGALIFKLVYNRPIWMQLLLISILLAVGLTGISMSTNTTVAVIFAWIQQLACGMTIPVLIAWGLNILPPEFRGTGMGFWSSGFFLGQFICPVVVSVVRNATGSLLNAFEFFGILCFALAIINATYNLVKKRSPVTA
ncbi:MAG: MFS transporter [Bacteroidetes bacterium]|nr:MFS transporter [Bacteroidota bacterium]